MQRIGAGIGGALAVMAGRTVLHGLLRRRAQSAMNQVHHGEVSAALARYADSAVLRLGEGDHRWAGEHHGRDAIESFLHAFADAGLVGRFGEVWTSGPPWAMRMVMEFEERLTDERGRVVYRNDLVMMLRTRWGRIVEHTDLAWSTGRIEELERRLRAAGRTPRTPDASPPGVTGVPGSAPRRSGR